jgi:Cytochrome c/c1 heme lyase
MGSSQSAPSHDTNNNEQFKLNSVNRNGEDSVKDDKAPKEKQQQHGSCPMKNADGSYRYDWGALFTSPHGRGGTKLLMDLKESISTNPVGEREVKERGCPVKSKNIEYNVYGQPIMNPSNNMPHNPNQLPSHTQSLPLSTERIPSSIPKVS